MTQVTVGNSKVTLGSSYGSSTYNRKVCDSKAKYSKADANSITTYVYSKSNGIEFNYTTGSVGTSAEKLVGIAGIGYVPFTIGEYSYGTTRGELEGWSKEGNGIYSTTFYDGDLKGKLYFFFDLDATDDSVPYAFVLMLGGYMEPNGNYDSQSILIMNCLNAYRTLEGKSSLSGMVDVSNVAKSVAKERASGTSYNGNASQLLTNNGIRVSAATRIEILGVYSDARSYEIPIEFMALAKIVTTSSYRSSLLNNYTGIGIGAAWDVLEIILTR